MRVPINTWSIDDTKVLRALVAIREAEKQGPVLIHCMHGADRTGVVAAVYRMAVQGWSREAAMKEMMGPDYGYHKIWLNLPRYLRKVDVADLRRKAGLPALPSDLVVNSR